MKQLIIAISTCLLTPILVKAQNSNYKVVFDMTSPDSVNQQSLIRQLTYIREANVDAQLEVVIYGQGLGLVTKDGMAQQAISTLLADKDTSFKVCAATLKRFNIDKSQLVPGVEIVPDGIYEIIQKQQQGWGYIKVGR